MNEIKGEIKAVCSRWIAVCVDMLDHPLVGMAVPPPKPADVAKHAVAPMIAWQDLIASAAWAAKSIHHKGAEIVLDRGQFLAARSHWAKRWNWGEQSVRSFFSRLAASDMIAICNQSNGHLANVACICNYDTYQSRKVRAKPAEKPEPNQSLTSGQPEGNQTLTRNTLEEEEPARAFEGSWVSLTQAQIDELVTDYPRMEFPADLKTTDNWLASINAALPRPPDDQRLTRLRSALATKNAERRILAEQIANVSKPAYRGNHPRSSSAPVPHKVSPDTVRYAKPRFDDEVKGHA